MHLPAQQVTVPYSIMGHALLQWLRPVTTLTGNMYLQRIHALLTNPVKLYAEINSLKDIHLKVVGALDLRIELDRVCGEGMDALPTQDDSGCGLWSTVNM